MADTHRQLSDMLSRFADVAITRSTTFDYQDLRDLVASSAAWAGNLGVDYQHAIQYGADPTGAADASDAIQTAIDAAGNSGNPSVMDLRGGVWRMDSGVSGVYDDMTWLVDGSKFVPTNFSNDAVITIGKTSGNVVHNHVRGKLVIRGSGYQWTGTIGLRLLNAKYTRVDFLCVDNLDKGLQGRGTNGYGCHNNTVFLGRMQSNRMPIQLTADDSGSCNAWTVVGGRLALQSSLSVSAATGYPIYLGSRPSTFKVKDATNATPIEITTANPSDATEAWSHGLETGDSVTVASVGGNTAANGTWTITKTGQTTFTLDGSAGNGAYTTGGTVSPANPGASTMTRHLFLGVDLEGNFGPEDENDLKTKRWPYGVFLNAEKCVFVGCGFELGAADGTNFVALVNANTTKRGVGCIFACPGVSTYSAGDGTAPNVDSGSQTNEPVWFGRDGRLHLNLPTVDPSNQGYLWNSADTVKVSAG